LITIIGSGLAGYTLVREIRKLDSSIEITLITQDNGDYYSKPQLSAAFTHHKTPEQLVIIRAEKFATQFNIQLKSHTTISNLNSINTHQAKLVLALGSKPVILPEFLPFPQKIYQVNNLTDYKIFRKALENNSARPVIIVGAGLVGCEFANDLIQGGFQVNLIAPESFPLANLIPETIGNELHQAFNHHGVRCHFNQFFDANTPHQYADSIILSAVGLQPDITLAQSHGILTNNGILVDSYLKTNKDNIYALGDCAEFDGKVMPYVAPIAIGARALAKTLLGEPAPVVYPPMPVFVKTSCYPIVSLLPHHSNSGNWKLDKKADFCHNIKSVRALFYNEYNELKGFALGGKFASEANEWVKLIIP
jgi:rubredoxin-NAD+ reductase